MTINENTKLYVVDIETDAIDATKIRCMSFWGLSMLFMNCLT